MSTMEFGRYRGGTESRAQEVRDEVAKQHLADAVREAMGKIFGEGPSYSARPVQSMEAVRKADMASVDPFSIESAVQKDDAALRKRAQRQLEEGYND